MTDTIVSIKPQSASYRLSIRRQLDGFIKRALDLCAACFGLLLLWPLFLLIATLIKRESPGPVFYRGPRIGKDGKPFGILKFRTMYEHPASYQGPRITAQDDGRITPLGRWLRDTKLNELPQLWNVLVGEMSLVGPRPEDPEIAKTWPAGARREVLSVRPGITSPASVIYRNEEKMLKADHVMDSYLKSVLPDKLRLDQLYVRNRNFLMDLDVIFYTLIALLPSLRKTPVPTESLYNGWLARFAKRYFSWFVADVLMAFAAVGLTGLIWRLSSPLDLGIESSILAAASMALVFSLVNFILGLGRVSWRYARPMYAFDLAFSGGISTLLLVTLNWRWPNGPFLPLGMILVSGLLAFLGFVSVRYRERLLTGIASRWLSYREKGDGLGERVLIVGAGECGLLACWLLQHSNLSSVFSIIGMVDDDPVKQGMMIDGHRVLGMTRRIPEIVEKYDVGVLLFAIERIEPAEQERILSLCHQTSARLVLVPDLLGMFRKHLALSPLPAGEGVE
ncbi:MAG: sugar transferase [Chloroflexi bacterium]|nr:sugar transferase [Chloroflexota bacterium]MBI3340192.1 sugar transferase [Chloroflexota bacterium]